jgi:uncharacterized membrane protein
VLRSLQAFVRTPRFLAVVFGVSGVLHLVRPSIYEGIVPAALPRKRELVYASGVVELACAAGLATGAGWAGPLSVATLVGVWPANIDMAVDASRRRKPLLTQVGLWARVPMQLPMIRTAMRARTTTASRS